MNASDKLQRRWKDEHREMLNELQKLDDRQTRNRNELYTLFSLYMVFQGVVITTTFSARASPTKHLCRLWWIPFTLSLISSVSIIWVVLDRMFDIGHTASAEQYVLDAQQKIKSSMSELQMLGVNFDVERAAFDDTKDWDRSLLPQNKFDMRWKDRVLINVWGILFLSTVFFVVVLASCKLLLCE